MGSKISLDLFALGDVSLVCCSTFVDCLLCYIDNTYCFEEAFDGFNIVESIDCSLQVVNQRLSGNNIFNSLSLCFLNCRNDLIQLTIRNREVLPNGTYNHAMLSEWIRMIVLVKSLIPCWVEGLLAVQVVAKCTSGNILNRESDCRAICAHLSVVLLLVGINVWNVCLVAVDNLCTAAGEGVAIINTRLVDCKFSPAILNDRTAA